MKTLITAIISVIALSASAQLPNIDYGNAYKYYTNCNSTLNVSFYAEATASKTTDSLLFIWDFGDGNIVSKKAATYDSICNINGIQDTCRKAYNFASWNYTNTDTFEASLIVEDESGNRDTAFFLIEGQRARLSYISSVNTNTCVDSNVIASASISLDTSMFNATNPLHVVFYWGDGNIDTTVFYPSACSLVVQDTHQYSWADTFSVKVEIITPEGAVLDEKERNSYVNVAEDCPAITCIKGKVFEDLDGDCIWDANESASRHWLVQLFMNDSIFYRSTKPDGDGWFYFNEIPKGNYTVRIDAVNSWWNWQVTCPDSGYINVNLTEDSCAVVYFGVNQTPDSYGQDLYVSVDPLGFANPGYNQTHTVGVCNIGDEVMSGTLIYTYDTLFSYVSGNQTPVQTGDTLKWNFSNLQPGSCFVTRNTMRISTNAYSGQSLNYKAIVEPISGDITQYNNIDSGVIIVGAPYDPNNKLASPQGVGEEKIILPSTPEIIYTINFQNTGTDTARNVFLLDTINTDLLDISTIKMGNSSHSYEVDFFGKGIMRINFDNIMLPDSNVNEPASHGFVQFRINIKPNLPIGTLIKNRVGIYFDYNEVVLTEYVINKIDTIIAGGVQDMSKNKNGISIYPNPAKSTINIRYNLEEKTQVSIEVYDLLGKRVARLANQRQAAGEHDLQLNVKEANLRPGIYFIKMNVGDESYSGKVMVIE